MTQKTETSRLRPTPGATPGRNRRAGFTLIELAVALTIMLMIVTMVIPTLTKMLSSRSQMEAFNLVAAQLTAARSEAITGDTYAGIHVQLGAEGKEDIEKTTYSMIIGIPPVEMKKDNLVFTRLGTFIPQELPGGTALGQLTGDYVMKGTQDPTDPNDTDPADDFIQFSDAQLKTFCAFSVIFSPDGSVATKVKGANVMFASNDKMFASGDTKLWDYNLANDKPGITVFTMFNYQKVFKLAPADRKTYLKKNGQFLPVNMNTGQLFDRY